MERTSCAMLAKTEPLSNAVATGYIQSVSMNPLLENGEKGVLSLKIKYSSL